MKSFFSDLADRRQIFKSCSAVQWEEQKICPLHREIEWLASEAARDLRTKTPLDFDLDNR